MTTSLPSSVLLDRAAGALVGLAAGDALGAGYEMTHPRPDIEIAMVGGGLGDFAPGEWTDDTAQAVAIARVTATGQVDLDAIGAGFLEWYAGGPPDVGISTGSVLRASKGDPGRLAPAAADYFTSRPNGAAGNGALMRTGPVALAHLGNDNAIATAAMEVAALTHGDPLAGEGCVLWCIAIDRAVREGRLDGVRDGLDLLPSGRRDRWADALDAADRDDPTSFSSNGFVISALQAAHAAIRATPIPAHQPGRHLAAALETAVRIGGDTDTVAAIAGQLLGARWGVSAVPAKWRMALHGWPELGCDDLIRLAVLTARGGKTHPDGWPSATHLPSPTPPFHARSVGDDHLHVGNLGGIDLAVEDGAEIIVSLCRVGTDDAPSWLPHLTVWLIDTDDPAQNPNLDLVLEDTVDQILRLRQRHGHTRVYVHCAAGASRTPTVVAMALARVTGQPAWQHFDELAEVLPVNRHNGRFQHALGRPPGGSHTGPRR